MTRITKRLGWAAVGITALLLLPLSTQAVEVSVSASSSGGDTSVLQPGDIITFDVSFSHASGERLFGLGIGVAGHDINENGIADDGLTFVGPNADALILPDFVPVDTSGTANVADGLLGVNDGAGNYVNNTGLVNIRGSFETPAFTLLPKEVTGQPVDLHNYAGNGLGAVEFGFNNPINALLGLPTVEVLHVSLFDGVSTTGTDGAPPLDFNPEIDPGVHFRLAFQATPTSIDPVQHTLTFGENAEFGAVAIGDGGEVLSTYQSSSFTLTVIPEPGTAVLMGLGLVGLAANRRR